MSRPMVRIHNIENDEIIDREMTDEEFAQYQADQEVEILRKSEAEAKANKRAKLLDRLGITEAEARILLG